MSNYADVRIRSDLAQELVQVLEHEVETAEEYHSTEQVMEDAARTIDDQI